MKKFIYFSMILVFAFTSCEQDEIIDPTSDQEAELIGTTLKGKLGKVAICHYDAEMDIWKSISINGNALTAHLNHGDVQLIDADGDGWVSFENECVPGGDCDDNDSTIYPGAEEICDGVDNNCDGIIDDEVSTTYYADSDGDGFGDPDTTIEACSQTTGYVIDNSDCDDTNSDINPSAEEICDNGIDDNCNGEVDEGCIQLVAIGDEYQGGIVAYILQAGDPGYDANVQHGLIAAPWSISCPEWGHAYPDNILIGTGEAIGTGQANTTAIVAALEEFYDVSLYAARICDDLVVGGYDDWFLPSLDELNQLYINKVAVGNFGFEEYYWSSTEEDEEGGGDKFAWALWIYDGSLFSFNKESVFPQPRVRAVRYF